MKAFRNKSATNKIGTKIRDIRSKAGFSLDDIADMTGFTQSSLSGIENGSETGISRLIEVAKAIGVHPKELLDVPIEIKPRFPLSPKRKERNRLTFTITTLCRETDFFRTPRFVRDVIEYLRNEYKTKTTAPSVSVVLLRLVEQGSLLKKKQGRQNLYFTKK